MPKMNRGDNMKESVAENMLKDVSYLFYTKGRVPIGCGIWMGDHIQWIPETCGCVQIDISDIDYAIFL